MKPRLLALQGFFAVLNSADPADVRRARLLPHTDKAGALALDERLRTAAQAMSGVSVGAVPGYTLSLGVATFPQAVETPEDLLQAADAAELAGKRAGKNRVCGAPALTVRRPAPEATMPPATVPAVTQYMADPGQRDQ